MERVEVLLGMSLALHPRGIGVPDEPPPLFPFALSTHNAEVRDVFEPFISAHFTDDEAWAALFTDEQRLSTFKAVHGNRKGKRRRANGQGDLFTTTPQRPTETVETQGVL